MTETSTGSIYVSLKSGTVDYDLSLNLYARSYLVIMSFSVNFTGNAFQSQPFHERLQTSKAANPQKARR